MSATKYPILFLLVPAILAAGLPASAQVRCGTPALRRGEAGPAARPFARMDEVLDTEHFRIHYATSGQDIIAGWPDTTYRDSLAVYVETAYRTFRDDPAIALPEPNGTGPVGAAGRPLIEFFVLWMPENYGVAPNWPTYDQPCSEAGVGYIELNNHFANGELYGSSRLSSAHEIFHLVQAATNTHAGEFIEESTAEWSELKVWPGQPGSGWEVEFFRSPYLPVWSTQEDREYGAGIFWSFLEHFARPSSGRFPAAEIQWRLCNLSWRDALSQVFAEAGLDANEMYHRFAIWNFYTGLYDDGRHYPDGDMLWGSVRVQASHDTYPVSAATLASHLVAQETGTNYIRFMGRAARRDLRVVIEGDPPVAGRRATIIATVRPHTHAETETVVAGDDGRLELRLEDWNLYDFVLVALTNPEKLPPNSDAPITYSATEEGDPAADVPYRSGMPGFFVAPNPASIGTFVRFEVSEADAATELVVYDVTGRVVRRLVDGPLPAGTYNRAWDGRDTAGHRVAAGAYLLSFRNGAGRFATKLTVLR
jgi:hypothetical protein